MTETIEAWCSEHGRTVGIVFCPMETGGGSGWEVSNYDMLGGYLYDGWPKWHPWSVAVAPTLREAWDKFLAQVWP
jgi:hypothetical protein